MDTSLSNGVVNVFNANYWMYMLLMLGVKVIQVKAIDTMVH